MSWFKLVYMYFMSCNAKAMSSQEKKKYLFLYSNSDLTTIFYSCVDLSLSLVMSASPVGYHVFTKLCVSLK